MTRRQQGFSLVELMITMVIFVFVIASVSQVFVGLLSQFKQQSKIAETNIEGIVGLNMLRRDMEHAGYGLPWNLSGAAYQEAADNWALTAQNDKSFNDGPPDNPLRGTDAAGASNPPGAFRSGDGVGFNGSDVLVIKAVNVAQSDASQKWTYLITGNTVKEWDQQRERMITSDRVIVINFFGGIRSLVLSGGTFTARYVRNNPYLDVNPDSLSDAGFAPPDETEQRIVYGVAEPGSPVTTPLRMPFNRADYYIRRPDTMPVRCADNPAHNSIGILYKSVLTQDGALGPEMPLLDCVADMQVIYRRDTDGDGDIDTSDTDISGLTAEQIRTTLRDVRVYILTHEGQRDPRFTFTNLVTCTAGPNAGNNVCVRVSDSANASWGRDFDLTTITDYEQYRWKVYTLAVQPFLNLR